MRNLYIAMIAAAFVACAPARVAPASVANALVIRITGVDELQRLTFEAINTSPDPLLITPAFGYDFYFGIEVVSADGASVRVPTWELTREIRGRCLTRGEAVSFRVPLRRWNAVHGTDATCTVEPCTSVQLPRGSYRVRAIYRPVKNAEATSHCSSLGSVVASEWLEFRVGEITRN